LIPALDACYRLLELYGQKRGMRFNFVEDREDLSA
jgi:hypothetical protein